MIRYYTQVTGIINDKNYHFHISRKGSCSDVNNLNYYTHLVGYYTGYNSQLKHLRVIGKVIHEG